MPVDTDNNPYLLGVILLISNEGQFLTLFSTFFDTISRLYSDAIAMQILYIVLLFYCEQQR